mmetsp:Transcript_10363/g.25397  ORF Transcript_10363/g.25397 Transcript_10363/m.25397 type:complete len:684 (+) Transcript_10363:304-2355(+)
MASNTVDPDAVDVFFLLYGAAMVFFMQAGFALLEVGSVSIRNTKNILFKNLMDVAFSTTTFYLFGYAFLYGGGNPFIGMNKFALQSVKFDEKHGPGDLNAQAHEYAQFIYAFAFAATATTIISGAVAERFQFRAYAVYGACMTSFFYPVVAHWVWCPDGWASAARARENQLFGSGAVDYAGAGVVHVCGGLAALIACVVVGPRVGRFNGRLVVEMPQQSPVFQTIGTFILWFGWYGFNCVAAQQISGGKAILAARAAVTTTISAATAGAMTVFVDHFTPHQSMEPRRMNNGIITGLVSISGSAGLIEPHFAVIVGVVAGFLYTCSSKLLLQLRIDDVVDAIPVHLVGGIWGLITPTLFMSQSMYMRMYDYDTAFAEDAPCGMLMGCKYTANLLAANLVLLLAIVLWIGSTCTATIYLIKWTIGIRVSSKEEDKGMDANSHGGKAYTEFQTTVFKFKTASGAEHSMEMRVRSGDAAKFAMALSEVMDASNVSGQPGAGGGGGGGGGRGGNMVFINNQPVHFGSSASESEGSSRDGHDYNFSALTSEGHGGSGGSGNGGGGYRGGGVGGGGGDNGEIIKARDVFGSGVGMGGMGGYMNSGSSNVSTAGGHSGYNGSEVLVQMPVSILKTVREDVGVDHRGDSVVEHSGSGSGIFDSLGSGSGATKRSLDGRGTRGVPLDPFADHV